ncbi:MAG: hypothetical protein SGARI_007599 [Bacillariaceae sp.]
MKFLQSTLLAAASSLSLLSTCNAATTVSQTVDVFEFTGDFGGGYGPKVDEGVAIATATRTEAGIGLYATTNGLPSGTYTIWWFIVNDPSVCVKNDTAYPVRCCSLLRVHCVSAHMFGALVNRLITATGDVVDETGFFSATAFLPVNNMAGEDSAQVLPGSVRGELSDPFGSEIHLDFLYHGPPLSLGDGSYIDDLYGQLRYTKGGCQFYADNGGMNPPPSAEGACPACHSAIFTAVENPNTGGGSSAAAAGGMLTLASFSVTAFALSF